MSLSNLWNFFTVYVREPRQVGALTPSSRALALALCDPLRRSTSPVRILEVGAGTGAITRHIGDMMRPGDEFDICEIQTEFADILRRDVLTLPTLQPAVEAGRVRLFCCPVQQLAFSRRYDFIISGLPFTAFELEDVQEVFDALRRFLKPEGVLSYYEYVGLRKLSAWFAFGRTRDRVRAVSSYLAHAHRDYQFDRRTVFQNFPPAHARHLCFDRRPATSSGVRANSAQRPEPTVPPGVEPASNTLG